MRQRSVALRERGRLATLLQRLRHQARQQPGWQEPDRRTTRTWRQFILGVLVAHATRLVTVSQALFGQRAAQSVKAVAMGLASFLTVADFPAQMLSPLVLAAAVRQFDPAQVATSRGKVVVALDPTEYAKRSRGRGRSQDGKPRLMEYSGRVRKPQSSRATPRRPRRPRRPGTWTCGRDWCSGASSSCRWPASCSPTGTRT